ncbi:putative inorganic phosphate cotransporter [Musca vetustissima]|uniref:putative inorganic phosphate cotransporter n=1 Tax=Musca vetustissima TaxID=27455 RepID=UPI002AB6DF83|nr:putative inorganic phosphate cotransporter [Musca vetustissima]
MEAIVAKGPFIGQRHIQSLLLFTCIAINYMTKYNGSISLVAMTNATTTNPNFPQYNWSEAEKSYILSSFFWGYVITQLPAGYVCKRFGAKATLFITTLGSSLVGLALPFTLKWGDWKIFCTVRVLQGFFQGFDMTAIYAHLAHWSPPEERNRLGVLANSGIDCGTVMAMFVSGLIATSSLGWPGISYISCVLGLIWCFFWEIFGANTPVVSKFITLEERDYIECSLMKNDINDSSQKMKSIPTPWKAILKSSVFWSLLVTRSAELWGFATVQSSIPAYMSGVFGMDMHNNALYSALPFIAMWMMSYVYLILADIILNYKLLALNGLRKTYNSIAFWLPALGLIAIGFVPATQQLLAGILLILIVAINSGNMIGSGLNVLDLSPNHAAVLMSVINTSGSIMPILSPLVTGAIVTDESNYHQWQIVFAISGAAFILGNIIYLIWGSTDLQPWNDPHFLKKRNMSTEYDIDDIPTGSKTVIR